MILEKIRVAVRRFLELEDIRLPEPEPLPDFRIQYDRWCREKVHFIEEQFGSTLTEILAVLEFQEKEIIRLNARLEERSCK